MMSWRGIIEEFKKFLPVTDQTPIVTLNEGNTPLLHARRLGEKICPMSELYLKIEGANPTGSFKDRGMTLAVSKAVEKHAKAIMCASTGNTSASAAAYGAKAGLPVYVLVPEGNIAFGKLAQAMIHGATVIQIEGNFDQALELVKDLCTQENLELVNSINPFRLQGQKTAAMEVCDQLGAAPTFHVVPVGNAGNISAYWMGYKEYHAAGQIQRLPKMFGFQAEGAAPIVKGHRIDDPQTVATAIRIGNPASWTLALRAVDESQGGIRAVSDDDILDAYAMLAKDEGVFCEPASAASVAGVRQLAAQGTFPEGSTIVCTLTGHGLKDPNLAVKISPKPLTVKPVREDVAALLQL